MKRIRVKAMKAKEKKNMIKLGRTSGNMGMKRGIDFAMFRGKAVTLKEKARLQEKEKMKKMRNKKY